MSLFQRKKFLEHIRFQRTIYVSAQGPVLLAQGWTKQEGVQTIFEERKREKLVIEVRSKSIAMQRAEGGFPDSRPIQVLEGSSSWKRLSSSSLYCVVMDFFLYVLLLDGGSFQEKSPRRPGFPWSQVEGRWHHWRMLLSNIWYWPRFILCLDAEYNHPNCGTPEARISLLACGHKMHYQCYNELLKTSRKSPECSKEIVFQEHDPQRYKQLLKTSFS